MTKPAYAPPTVRRIAPGALNPQRHGRAPVLEAIDGVAVTDLLAAHGSPLFVFSEADLRAKARALREAFTSRYPEVVFAWSYKTNYLDAICRVFHDEGWIAEVVSDFEYEKARGNGIAGSDIVFNGPWKSPAALRRAVDEGAMLQIDNGGELLALARIADELEREIPVALRVHLDTGTHAPWSKFGFDADTGEAARMIQWLAGHTRLRLRGLHAHIGTFMLDAGAYAIAVERLVGLALGAEQAGAGPVEYLNVGGGFASHARLHGQVAAPEQATPGFDRYAEEICGTVLRLWPADRRPPRLILETGRALVDEAGYLLATVVAVKNRRVGGNAAAAALAAFGKDSATLAAYGKTAGALAAYGKETGATLPGGDQRALVVDAGINLLYTTAWYQPTIHVARTGGGTARLTTLYGCLCMNIDVIREQTPLPEDLRPGDAIVVHPVGAYNWTQSMQFITYRPAVVLVAPDGGVHVIRRREQLEDVRGPEQVPAHLAGKPRA